MFGSGADLAAVLKEGFVSQCSFQWHCSWAICLLGIFKIASVQAIRHLSPQFLSHVFHSVAFLQLDFT